MKEETKILLEKYLKRDYGNGLRLEDYTNKNSTFDLLCTGSNINISIELKERFFTSKIYDDVLIEIVQHLNYLCPESDVTNSNCNMLFTAQKLLVAQGWFSKCQSDRLIFIRYKENIVHDLIDIDFRFFKNWLLDAVFAENFKLQYSDLTTGTLNIVVPLEKIPKGYYRKFENNK